MEKKYPNLMPAPTSDGPQTLCGMFDDLATRKDFVDLRPLMDDKTPSEEPPQGLVLALHRQRLRPRQLPRGTRSE